MFRRMRNGIINRCIVPFIEKHRWLEPYWIRLYMSVAIAWSRLTFPLLYRKAWKKLRGVKIPEGYEVWASKSGRVFLVPEWDGEGLGDET